MPPVKVECAEDCDSVQNVRPEIEDTSPIHAPENIATVSIASSYEGFVVNLENRSSSKIPTIAKHRMRSFVLSSQVSDVEPARHE